MPTEVLMPKLGLTMVEGTIVEWKKNERDEIKKGEILYVLETEKVSYEVEAPESGILGKIVAKVGDVIPVGGLVAYILQPGEKHAEITEVAAKEGESKVPVEAEVSRVEGIEVPSGVRISPLARKIAEEHNIDVFTITGTGPGGRIVKEDILNAVERREAAAERPREAEALAEEEIRPLSSMRKVIARRMTETFQAPHFYLTVEVDAQELERTRETLIPLVESKVGVKLTFTDLLIKTVARSLEDNPAVNCTYIDGAVKLFKRIDIGLITAVEGGLISPVIRQANKKSLPEISALRAQLTQKARDRKLSTEEMTGSTFTISNLGMFDIDQFSALIQPPEGALLAVGRIIDRPVARNGQIVIRPIVNLTLSIDHRVLDGVAGANFLTSLKSYIENPSLML